MKKLIEQIKEKGFQPMKFSIFNYMDDNGDIVEMEGIFKQKFGIEDFEYMAFELELNEKNGLKYRAHDIMKRFYDLQTLIEETIQEDKNKSKAKVFILKDDGQVFVVKFKDFDLLNKLEMV